MLPVLEKNEISVFSGLNDIIHLLDQAFSSSRSSLITVFIWSTLWIEYPSDVSSANNLLNDIYFSPISFMYIRNMRGPNTDPWGTPAETGSKLDQEFLLITLITLDWWYMRVYLNSWIPSFQNKNTNIALFIATVLILYFVRFLNSCINPRNLVPHG